MKKLIMAIFALLLMHQIVYAIPSGDDFYQNYFKIESKGFSGNYLTYWGPINDFINPTIGTHVGYLNFYSGANSQQWLIAPVQPGSDEFFIINKYSGNPIYVDGNDVKYNGGTIEKRKQIFKFQNINGEYSQITLVSDLGFLYHKRHTTYSIAGFPNGYYYSLAYYTNKPSDDYSYFKLTIAESIPAASNVSANNLIDNTTQVNDIPYPPQLSSYNDGMSEYVNTTTIAETWVPFCLVNDPSKPRKLQVQETPYYKMIRKQTYKKAFSVTNTPGVIKEYEKEEFFGVEYSETIKFQTILNHSWKATGEAEFVVGKWLPSLKTSISSGLDFSISEEQVYSTDTKIEKRQKRKISFNSNQSVRIIIFNIADIVRLERMDGSKAIDDTEIVHESFTSTSAWPPGGIITQYDPTLNKVTIIDDLPPSTPQNLAITESPDEYSLLSWTANSEPDLKKYNVYREGGNPFVDWAIIGNTVSNTYKDTEVTTTYRHGEEFFYKVTAVDYNDNESDYSNTVEIEARLEKQIVKEKLETKPKEYELHSNYPNPFNPSTQISYQIPNDGFVNLIVYNSLGQEVSTLINKHQTSGQYSIQFNAANLPSGVYIYKLQAGEFSSTKKMILAK